MVVFICHAHHSVNNNHSFINFCKHAIPLYARAADKALSKDRALYLILMCANSLACLSDYSTAQKYPGYSEYRKQTSL